MEEKELEPVSLHECFSVAAEIIRELLQGKSSQEILDNIDLNDEHLKKMAAAMMRVTDEDAVLAVVLNDGDTFTGLRGCSIREVLEEEDEDGNEFGDVIMNM